jgi:MYXO-CTERM domain-containing protein
VPATVGGVAVTSATVSFAAPPSGGGGGCSSGGAAGLPALVLLALGLLRRGARGPRG